MKFPWIDKRWLQMALAHVRESVAHYEQIAATREDPPRVGTAGFLFDYYGHLTRLEHAAGARAAELRGYMLKGARAYASMVEAREQARALGLAAVHPHCYGTAEGEEGDFSATHSKDSLQAAIFAELAGDPALARRLTETIWDADDAAYLGERPGKFVLVTMAERFFAYTHRDMSLERDQDARQHLRRVRTVDARLLRLRGMLEAALMRDAARFCGELKSQLAEHERKHRRKASLENFSYLLDFEVLACVLVALRRGVVTLEGLPTGNPYLPLELLKGATDSNGASDASGN